MAKAARASLLELLLCWKLLVNGLVSLRVLELICNSSLTGLNPHYNWVLPIFGRVFAFVADAKLGCGVAQSSCAATGLRYLQELN